MYITSDTQEIAHHIPTKAQLAPQAVQKHKMNSHPFKTPSAWHHML